MPHFSEKSVAEDYFIEKLKAKGWRFVPADELERESFEEPLLIPNLIRSLKKLNAKLDITDEEIKKVLNELKLKSSTVEGIKGVLNLFKQGVPIKFEKDRLVKYVKLFDYENPEQNDFIASRQVVYNSGRGEIRTDIMLYVNGIPLVDIECKNPASFSESWFDAYKQIKEYEQKIPELYKYVQIGVAAEQIVKYFAIVPWEEETRIYEWKEQEQNDPVDSTIEMLAPNRLLDILRNYLFFRIEFGSSTKVITRYMQYRASEKIVKRVLDNFNGTEDKNKGLIWHWQGSGKTLTMIFAVNKLYRNEILENPTIFFVVDRQDLQIQLEQEFNALDIPRVEVIDSIEALRKTLKHDEGKGKRGIMITLIHKFRAEELDALQKELEAASKTNSTILNRKNVLAFVDEGHRTQYGTMAAQMRNILRKAFFFAFTGTPIAKGGKDTYEAFSYPPQEKYFDKYFITDSIRDGFTVKIVYQPRLEELHLKKEQLEAFLEIQEEELPEEFKEKINESVKKKLTASKVILENPENIRKKAENINQHFKENVDGKFKAMVVAVNRTACVHYKKALDEFLPSDWSEIVMTYDRRNDPKIIQDYFKGVLEKNNGKELEDIRKEIVEKFKEEEKPKILIVTDMLLTGFDAPILQTMYLDKPLEEHRLLQAIARTNRPYKDLKEIGLILDYVGILKEVTKAFEMYTKDDREEISGAIEKFDDLQHDFVKELDSTIALFKGIPKDKFDRETLLKAIEVLTSDDAVGKLFIKNYKSLRRLFELLGPNVIKAQRFSDYRWLTAIYVYYYRMVFQNEPHEELRYVNKYFEKTLKFVHKSTELTRLADNLPPITIDENYLNALEEKAKSKEEKAANIVFALNRFVLVDRYKNPISETLAEKVEKLLKLWKEKTKDFEKIYKEGVKFTQQIQKLSERQKELKFSKTDYALLLTLENKFGQNEELIKDIMDLSKTLQEHLFPDWYLQTTARKNVEREIRTFLRKYVKSRGLEMTELEQIYQKMIKNVKDYGKNA